MKFSRRAVIRGIAVSTAGGRLIKYGTASSTAVAAARSFPYVQMDVFTSQRLEATS